MSADGTGIVIAIVLSICGSVGFLAAFITSYCDSFLRRFAQLLESHKEEKKPASKDEADKDK